MGKLSAVVVRNNFVTPESVDNYAGNIGYQNKKSGRREEVLKQYEKFEEYVDSYMANPEKSTGLFTKEKNNLTTEEVQKYKDIFEMAQGNGSLLWRPIISFDNAFLEEHGLYRSKDLWVDESKMKEYIRTGVNQMLHNENLDHAVWIGSFHYNTDNLHAHIAVVEPDPIRPKKLYERDGRVSEEFVGRFKLSSMKKCRSYLTNEIMGDKSVNIRVNDLIRKSIVGKKKETLLHKEVRFRKKFLTIYDQLPQQKNRWNYNDSLMRNVRPLIDDLSRQFLIEFQNIEFLELKDLIWQQNERYQELYGRNHKKSNYFMNKTADLYSRLGNAILKEMKAYDEVLQVESIKRKMPEKIVYEELPEMKMIDETFVEEYENAIEDLLEFPIEDMYIEWTDRYKEARAFLYGTDEMQPDFELAFEKMHMEAEFGNILAIYDMGEMYYYGRGLDVNLDQANQYYKKALRGLEQILNKKPKNENSKREQKSRDYVKYRIGKMYYSGKGTEKNMEKAFQAFEGNTSTYAVYTLGLMYKNGDWVEKNPERAFAYLKKAAEGGMPYAAYEVAKMYEEGLGTKMDLGKAEKSYKIALSGFEKFLKSSPDDRLFYRVGMMCEFGKGTETDKEKAIEHYERAAFLGNIQAHISLARIYLEEEKIEKIKLAVTYLEKACLSNDSRVQYELGKLYLMEIPEIQDYEKGITYLREAAEQENVYASYQLGKFYLKGPEEYRDYEKGIGYLRKAIEQNNEYAKYTLGTFYVTGPEEYQNYEEGIAYLQEAAEQENVYAKYQLGKFYLMAEPGYKNEELAEFYLLSVIDMDNAAAKYLLGNLYSDRDSKKYDPQKAEMYFKEVIGGENHYSEYAQLKLGRLYQDKNSSLYDRKKAIECLKPLAERDNPEANLMMGVIYLQGKRSKSDMKTAREYFKRAEMFENEYAKEFIRSMDKKSPGSLKHHNNRQLNEALGALRRGIKNESQKAINEYEFERSLNQEILIE